MNYRECYNRLIDRAKSRILEGYGENHHILPKCMGGADDSSNIVRLTAREHFIAHQLLVKIYPDVSGLTIAALLLRARSGYGSRRYEWLRLKWSKDRKAFRVSEETKRKISTATKGKKKPADFGNKVSNGLRGNKNALGHKQSNEHIRKRSSANSIAFSGKQLSASHVEALKAGKVKEKQKRIEAGVEHFNLGRKQTEQQKQKFSAKMRGRKQSAAHIAARIQKATETRKRRLLEKRHASSI